MTRGVKKALVLVTGWMFIVLGIVGLFLPIMQGVLFLMIGLTILSSEYVWAHHLLAKVRGRFPRLAALTDRAREKATGWMRRVSRPQGTQ